MCKLILGFTCTQTVSFEWSRKYTQLNLHAVPCTHNSICMYYHARTAPFRRHYLREGGEGNARVRPHDLQQHAGADGL